jgi:ElaB/YqjD/DUF883 family membrane-anchored ribosome-binding protein
MTDHPIKDRTGSSAPTGQSPRFSGANQTNMSQTEKLSSSVEGPTDRASAAGRDFKAKAADLAGSSAEAIAGRASDFVDAAKDATSQASDRIQQEVKSQKIAGAEFVGNLADTMRRAAGEFESDIPIAATYIRKAASHVDTISDSIQRGNFNVLLRGAQSFARKQPAAFLGLAALAGFGVGS